MKKIPVPKQRLITKKPKINKNVMSLEIRKTRQNLLETRGHVCEKCLRNIFVTKYLHMHHINRDRRNNKLHNLILLCATCHAKEHCDNQFSYKVLIKQSYDMENILFD